MNFDNWKQQDFRAFLRVNLSWYQNHLTCCISGGCLHHNHYDTCGVCNTAGPWQTPSMYLDICIIEYLFVSSVHNWVYFVKFCIIVHN